MSIYNGIVLLNCGDEMTLMAVAQTGDWESDRNRTLTVKLTDLFDEDLFVGRMYHALEKIVVAVD